ncbi:hypothetical protein [Bryobacter aggregatus]|uniref:hypothetical protein n=1 Tax=Bryobacter aggregatus TaxID=360054 RepID=UPI0004E24D08|nr:hypothetical protein [Bryobacter aggregatus]
MTPLFLILLAIDGTVVNKSTGKPAAEVPIVLMRLGDGGMMPVGTVKSGPDGKFDFKQNIDGPLLMQAIYDGVNYNKLLRPGDKPSGLELDIYNTTRKPGDAKIVQHMMLVEPSEDKMSINESVIYRNDSKSTYSDPENGTFRFYLPPEAKASLQVRVSGPGNMPVRGEAKEAGPANIYKIDFAIKPGESRFDLQYVLPAGKLKGRILHPVGEKEGPTRLVTPSGVKLSGLGVEDLGAEPQTQAEVYSLSKPDYEIEVSGTGSLRALDPDETAMPEPQAIPPKISERMWWIVGLSLLALSFGFVSLLKKA